MMIKNKLSETTITFDKSTELLLSRRDIRRETQSKVEKATKLAQLEVKIERHLNDLDVKLAKRLASTYNAELLRQ